MKNALLRHAIDYHWVVRIGTNLPDKKVFMNLRRMVSEIHVKNGGQPITDANREIMTRIHSIVRSSFEERDLEIVQARMTGHMTGEKFDTLVDKHGIFVKRIRQIQRAARLTICEGLQR